MSHYWIDWHRKYDLKKMAKCKKVEQEVPFNENDWYEFFSSAKTEQEIIDCLGGQTKTIPKRLLYQERTEQEQRKLADIEYAQKQVFYLHGNFLEEKKSDCALIDIPKDQEEVEFVEEVDPNAKLYFKEMMFPELSDNAMSKETLERMQIYYSVLANVLEKRGLKEAHELFIKRARYYLKNPRHVQIVCIY